MFDNVIEVAECMPGAIPERVYRKRLMLETKTIEQSRWYLECVCEVEDLTFWCLRCPECNPLPTPQRGATALDALSEHCKVHGW